jgi:hypothetical protein
LEAGPQHVGGRPGRLYEDGKRVEQGHNKTGFLTLEHAM